MKKFFTVLLSMLMSMHAFAFVLTDEVFTYEYEGQTVSYTVVRSEEGKTCVTSPGEWYIDSEISYLISPGNNVSGSLTIPTIAVDSKGESYTVVGIGKDSFNSNEITSVALPATLTEIGLNAFEGCANLSHISIPQSVTEISNAAFMNCTSLPSFTIPQSVTEISEYLFSGCTSLTSVEIPESITRIGLSAFNECSNLSSVALPESVTFIASAAFYKCTSLTSINIPEAVTYIASNAFSGCNSLTSIILPESLSKLENNLFYGCSNLSSINIPESTTSIGNNVFYGCSNLTSVSIPASVTKIGNTTFANCEKLESVYYSADEPIKAPKDTFDDTTYDEATLYVPEKAVEKCKEIEPWKNFKNIHSYDFAGIDTPTDSSNISDHYEIFNLNGTRVASNIEDLPTGIYIVRIGSSVKKIAIP